MCGHLGEGRVNLREVEARNKTAWTQIWRTASFVDELATLKYPRSREEIVAYMPFLSRSGRVLEAGCGLGRVAIHLRDSGFDVIGVDYCADALQEAKQHAPDLRLVLADIRHLPFGPGSYQAYLSFGVLEHFFDGPTAALREANRALQDGGILVMTVPYPNVFQKASAPIAWLRRNRFVRWLFRKPPATEVSAEGYYETSYDRVEIERHLQATGFEIIMQRPVGHAFNLWLLAGVFRKERSYYDTTSFAESVAGVMRWLAPWVTSFMVLTIAKKQRAIDGLEMQRSNRASGVRSKAVR